MSTRHEPEETEYGPAGEIVAAARRAVQERYPHLYDQDDSQAIPAFVPRTRAAAWAEMRAAVAEYFTAKAVR